jgi:hypothetical protein
VGIVIFGAAMSKSRENLQKSIINQLLNFKSLLKKPTHLYLFKQEKQSMSHFLKPFTVGRRRRRSNDSLQADDLRQIGKKNLNLHNPAQKEKKITNQCLLWLVLQGLIQLLLCIFRNFIKCHLHANSHTHHSIFFMLESFKISD